MLTIDGSEGGGQIIRTALALSALTSTPFKAENIRAARPKPGLKAQHLAGILALQELCSAEVDGALEGSSSFTFKPGQVKGRTISLDIGTAGSITLLFQSVLLPALFADEKTRFRITGGTDTAWSMPVDYFMNVVLPYYRVFADIECELVRRGYYPAGGGKVDLTVRPRHRLSQFPSVSELLRHLHSLNISFSAEPYQVVCIKGISHAHVQLQKAEVAERQARAAKVALLRLGIPVSVTANYAQAESLGSGITLWAVCRRTDDVDPLHPVMIGSDCLGERGKRAEEVGTEAAQHLIATLAAKATADMHLTDNLVPLLALTRGEVTTTGITGHVRTNIRVVEQFLPVRFRETEKTIAC
ncbi:MAG: RNA 3'-terminal phosphate cyclase [Nanoarchaeota archaeon]